MLWQGLGWKRLPLSLFLREMRHLKRQHLLAAVAGGLVAGRDGAGTAAAFCFPSSAVSSVGGGGRGAGSIGGILRSISADLPDISAEALQEAEAIMSKLQSSADGPGVGQGLPGQEKYMPSIKEGDPVVEALCKVLGCESVEGFTLLDSRWNGNEAFRFDTDRGARSPLRLSAGGGVLMSCTIFILSCTNALIPRTILCQA